MVLRRLVVLACLAAGCSGAAENLRSDPEAVERRGKLELQRAMDAEKANNTRSAKRHYLAALNLRPEDFETAKRASFFFRGSGDPDKAAEIATNFVEQAPGDPRGYHLLADVQFANGNEKAAVDTMSELLTIDDENAKAYHSRGRALMNLGKARQAMEDYERAVKLSPENPAYLTSLGFALSRSTEAGPIERAEEVLRKALEIEPDNPDANRLLGTVKRKKFDPKAALAFHVKAVELDPESALNHFELGITQNALGQNDEAEESLKEALELNPNDAIAWYAYGEVLRITNQCPRAIAAYEKALELDPNNDKAPNKLGVCYFKVQKYDKAELVLTAAIQKTPEDPYPYFNLGMVYALDERPHAAIKALRKFIELAPSGDGDIATAKREITKLEREIRKRY